jgi:hypothetical protein
MAAMISAATGQQKGDRISFANFPSNDLSKT